MNASLAVMVGSFKIDLIVWKYGRIDIESFHEVKFKIDLIVWKLVHSI